MKKIIILILTTGVLVSCGKKLNLNPQQSVDEKLVFTSDKNIKAALQGAYDVVSGSSLVGGDLQLYAELLGANKEISWVGTYQQPREIFRKAMLTNNAYLRDTYTEAYRAINICNNIIEAIDVVNASDRNKIKGQALFIRGLMYFELVKIFAQPYSAGNTTTNPGLQIVTTPTKNGEITAANKVPRSSVEQTYQQIVSDLTTAKPLMSNVIGVYAGKYTAAAVLSRVYLQMGDYQKAAIEANDVIVNSGASLESDCAKAFNNTAPSSEDIYVMPVTAQHGSNSMWLFWSISDYGARDGDVEVEQKQIDLFAANDKRLANWFYIDDNDIYRSAKWQYQYRYLPFIRLAEMYLTRAECNARLGTSLGATPSDDLNNVIRARAGVASVPATVDNIIYERRLELVDEGQKIHDMKRLKQSTDGFAYNDNKLVCPIPQREINAGNGVLVQNAGYTP